MDVLLFLSGLQIHFMVSIKLRLTSYIQGIMYICCATHIYRLLHLILAVSINLSTSVKALQQYNH